MCHVIKEGLRHMIDLESIQSLIRKRKLQWVAHCARRGDKDLMWKRMVREDEDEKSKWGSRLKEEWKTLGVNTVRGWCNKVEDRCWLASKLVESNKKKTKKAKGDTTIVDFHQWLVYVDEDLRATCFRVRRFGSKTTVKAIHHIEGVYAS